MSPTGVRMHSEEKKSMVDKRKGWAAIVSGLAIFLCVIGFTTSWLDALCILSIFTALGLFMRGLHYLS